MKAMNRYCSRAGRGLTLALVLCAAWARPAFVVAQSVWYVDRDATGANNGTSWSDAFTNLTGALAVAQPDDQVLVAQGVYKPAAPGGNRLATFAVPRGVAVQGGYAGVSEPDPNVRDLVQYETVLSGDLNGNDVGTNGRAENSVTVVTPRGVAPGDPPPPPAPPTVLDGLTIRSGFADQFRSGGGMFAEGVTDLALTRCTLRNNSAGWDGGGICSHHSRVTVEHCRFLGNSAGHDGGGLCHRNGALLLSNSRFVGNFATSNGGGLYFDDYNVASHADVSNCTFVGNVADAGVGFGSAAWFGGDATVTACAFLGNTAYTGGAVANTWAPVRYVNCLFSGNAAAALAGGLHADGFTGGATLINCTLSDNAAEEGGGVLAGFGQSAAIANSVLWNNADAGGVGESAQVSGAALTLRHSLIAGWTGALGGEGNSGADPMFVDAAGPDDLAGTEDDNLRLRPGSAAIDSGDNEVDVDPFAPGQQPLPNTDLDGNPRFVDDPNTADSGVGTAPLVDRGPYEFQASSAPAALVIGAGTRRAHSGHGYQDIEIDLAGRVGGIQVTSEPRNGGLTELRLAFDQAPAEAGADGIILSEAACGAGPADAASFIPYGGISQVTTEASPAAQELVVCFSPGLENARTYRIQLGGEVTSLGGQSLEVRVLRGDADDNGRVNGSDRSAVVAVWTSVGFSPRTDIDGTGQTGSVDRSSVVEAWTGAERCAP